AEAAMRDRDILFPWWRMMDLFLTFWPAKQGDLPGSHRQFDSRAHVGSASGATGSARQRLVFARGHVLSGSGDSEPAAATDPGRDRSRADRTWHFVVHTLPAGTVSISAPGRTLRRFGDAAVFR